MKRIKSLRILLLLTIVLLTGCSNKLKCEIKTNNYNAKAVVKYKDNKPTTYNFSDKMNYTAADPEAEIYYHSKLDEYSNMIIDKYVTVRDSMDGVSVKIKYDFTENHSEDEKLLPISRDDNKAKSKSKLEDIGFTCK